MPLGDVELALQRPKTEVVDALAKLTEDQWYERKSFRVSARDLAEVLVGLGNADGGWVVIGLSSGKFENVRENTRHLNGLLQAAADFTEPRVRAHATFLNCESESEEGEILVFEVPPSDLLHRMTDGTCFLRIGDETRKLRDTEAVELAYDKGNVRFETAPVPEASVDDLDVGLLTNYAKRLGSGDPMRTLRDRTLGNPEQLTVASVLLFCDNPQRYLPNALVRVSRYSGTTRQTGRSQNLVADFQIGGSLPRMIQDARRTIAAHQPTRRALDDHGVFDDVPTVPADAWLEGLVNAVVHRSYSMEGDHVHVDIFDDRIEIFSPGRFPHVVDLSNVGDGIRRYARNPRIVRVCFDLRICQELGEGIRRMFDEMRRAGLKDPLYKQDVAGVTLTLSAAPMNELLDKRFPGGWREIVAALRDRRRMSTAELVEVVGLSRPAVRARLSFLQEQGVIEWRGKSANDPRAYWCLPEEDEPSTST